MRRNASAASSCSFSAAIRRAALSVTTIRRSPAACPASTSLICLPAPSRPLCPNGVFKHSRPPVKAGECRAHRRPAMRRARRSRIMLRALPGGRDRESEPTRRRPQAGADKLALSRGARTQGAVALDLDDPQRQPSAAEPRRAQGRRPSGVERLGRDLDDRALSRCDAAAGPGRGQAARRAGVPRAAISSRAGRAATSSSGSARFGGAQSYPSRTKDGATSSISRPARSGSGSG